MCLICDETRSLVFSGSTLTIAYLLSVHLNSFNIDIHKFISVVKSRQQQRLKHAQGFLFHNSLILLT